MQLTRVAALLFLPLGLVVFHANAANADDWPQFRGPASAGKADATGLPTTWSDQTNIVWRTALPGAGASSPVTFGDKIYVTCYTGQGPAGETKRVLVCMNRADGSVSWTREQTATADQKPYQGFIALHGYASGTPSVDDTGIYVYYGATGAAAYGHDGRQLWLTPCGTGTHGFGTANSPTLYKNLVIINAGVESGQLIALDKTTGRKVWAADGMSSSWNTPTLATTADGNTEVVVNTKGKVLAFNPDTGDPLWSCDAINDYICPSVLAEGDTVFAIGGRKNTALAIRTGGRGDVTDTHKLWEIGSGANVPSPVYHEGHLYWTHDSRGIAYCVDAKTGEMVYEQRLEPSPGKIYASPTFADGKIYLVSREKGAYVLPAKPEFQILAHNEIKTDDSIFNGSPVISQGQILLRSDKYLYCIGQ